MSRVAGLAFAVLAPVLVAVAAPGLQALKGEITNRLNEQTLPVLKKQVEDLRTIERKAAELRDYDTAIAAKQQRQKLESIIEDQEKTLLVAASAGVQTDKPTTRVVLKLSDAKDFVHVRYDKGANILSGWASPGDSATWQLPNLPPGGYEVVLTYESSVQEGGTVMVQEKFFTLSSPLRTTLDAPFEHKLGILRIRDGSGPFKITATQVLRGGLMRLHSVELVSVNHTSDE